MNNIILHIFIILTALSITNAVKAKDHAKNFHYSPQDYHHYSQSNAQNSLKNKWDFFSKLSSKKVTRAQFQTFLDRQTKRLVNAKTSAELRSVGSCKKDKIADLSTVDPYGIVLGVKYESGIYGFWGEFNSIMIGQQRYFPKGLVTAKVGDEVELCLIEKSNCMGQYDQRGSFYHATNMRTGHTWVLRNSIYSCGDDFELGEASLDCKHKTKPDEKLICNNPKLTFYHHLIGAQYDNVLSLRAISGDDSINDKRQQQDFVKNRALCQNPECLYNLFEQRLSVLDHFLVKPQDFKFFKTCSKSKISSMTSRFGDTDFKHANNGFVIGYELGHSSMSNNIPPAILRSKIGDEVILCHNHLPRNCPFGDNRGGSIKAFNMRTNDIWSLAKNSRSCGGS